MMVQAAAEAAVEFKPGDLVRARDREWVVLPETRADLLRLRPLGGTEDDATLIYLPLEPRAPAPATFDLPDPDKPGSHEAALLLRDAIRLKLRAGAGPFRSFGNLNVEPRAYQLVPLLMALKLGTVRLLVADDVGIGKTIEAGLIARELLDRGEIERLAVICPPHLCEQWQQELSEKFSVDAEVVRTGTASRLERGLRPDESVFEVYPFTVVSLDYIKSDRRRSDFLRACPEFVIVDEAHSCVRSNTNTRHQRYQLLKGLADSEPRRGMVFLTATPIPATTQPSTTYWVCWNRSSQSWRKCRKARNAAACATDSRCISCSAAAVTSTNGRTRLAFRFEKAGRRPIG